MTASIASKAPHNDLELLNQCQMYHTNILSNSTVKKMAGQLWYLSEELVILALFVDVLDNTTNDKMVITMKEKEGKEKPLKHATINMKLIQEKTLVDFTTQISRLHFNNLCLPDDFLEYPENIEWVGWECMVCGGWDEIGWHRWDEIGWHG